MAKDEAATEASRILKAELARRGITYKVLARLLAAQGEEENDVQLKTKVNRGTFSFAFFIKVMRAIGASNIDLAALVAPGAKD